MAKKPTKRKSTAKPKKTAKKAKAAKPRTARKVAKPKKTAKKKVAKKAVRKTAKKTAKKKTAKRKPAKKTVRKAAKKTAKKKAVKRAAPAAALRITATPAKSSDKDHLISVIQSGTGSSKKAAGDTLAAVLGTVAASLKKNQKVQLVGFGSFDVVRRRARQGRNPATGAPIRIKASKGVRFKAGTKLKAGL